MRRVGICSVALVICVCFVLPSHAFFNSEVRKAREFIQAGMYPQAIELLNKRINDKPTDAEAHFILGTCYLSHQGDMGKADQRFESAVKLEPKYGSEAAAEFLKAGNISLDQGNVLRAQDLYSKALQYNPGLRSQIAQGCFDRGAASMNPPLFDLAAILDPSYKMKAYNLIMDKVETVAGAKEKFKLYRSALGFNYEAKQTIIDAVAAIAKTQARNLVESEIRQFPSDVSEHIVAIVWPPDFKYYNPRENAYPFTLKAGEYATDHFIHTTASWRILSNNGQFEIVKRNGEVIKIWKGEELPSNIGEFKIRAVADTFVGLVVGH